MGLPVINKTGFIIGDVELKFTPGGKAVVKFPVAFSYKRKNEETGEWERVKQIVFRATAWEGLAENIAETFTKNTEIHVAGEIYSQTYTDKEGAEKLSLELDVREASKPVPRFVKDAGGQGKPPSRPNARGDRPDWDI